MKRLTTAALAATTALAITIAPAHAADDPSKPGSSELYQECLKAAKEEEQKAKAAGREEEFKKLRQERASERGYSGSSNEGVCIGLATDDNPGAVALIILLPVAIVALLGGGIYAAASGMIPGVSLPGVPGLPKL
ncbi:hypothetical protein MHJ95_02735 [Corynebacterium imitans]|uniref:hypothetical protein n=1 Tax=Corynebacterium imitans TaxID=156978 RepID=UPI001EF29F49|nr:hypothetical protein [Corynebacterium imitans]MCG7277914.1 hypothetical protein [Corynebacterium imitans]